MRVKSIIGVIMAMVPVVYCGGLLYYFLDVSGGSVDEIKTNGLGPTVIGLGAFGLLFLIPLLIKIVRLVAEPRAPGSSSSRATNDSEDAFDADATLARYMAKRSADAAADPTSAPSAPDGGAPRTTFGRKGTRDER